LATALQSAALADHFGKLEKRGIKKMKLDIASEFDLKPGRVQNDTRRANDRAARQGRQGRKTVRLLAVAKHCEAANRKPTACKGHLEAASKQLPKSHKIILAAMPDGVQRVKVVPKRKAKECIGA
jgi:hypothetical protein